ncbi:MAG: peptide chain release factor N(5)-glutamine methyltransferase [Patescibacteria group bacterium]|nr:peptide chain release factor N(5)-glutamine methyltransferase [Patescibacteria group bacterium]
MNIRAALVFGVKETEVKNIDQPEIEAEEILSFVLKKNREFLFTYPEKKLNFCQSARYKYLIKRRVRGAPLAYLTGHREFYGLDFKVNRNVLIPRPETELMVDEILKRFKNARQGMISTWQKKSAIRNIIDLGTGSGCIIISLAKNWRGNKIKYWGLDISRKALAVARRNARLNGLKGRINFLYSDLLNNIDKKIFKEPLIIAANLPYLTAAQVKDSPTIQREPKIALLAGVDGLDHYRRLFRQIKDRARLLKNKIFVFCEIDDAQRNPLETLVKQNFSNSELSLIKDLGGHDRLAIIELH